MFDKATKLHIPQLPNIQSRPQNQENWTEEFKSQQLKQHQNQSHHSNSNSQSAVATTNIQSAQNQFQTQKTAQSINTMVLSQLDSKLNELQMNNQEQQVNQNLWNAANDILNSQDAKYLNNTEFIKFVKQIKNKEIELVDNEFIQKLPFNESDYVEDLDAVRPTSQPILEQGFDAIKSDLDQWTAQYEQNLQENNDLTMGQNDQEWNELNKDYKPDGEYIDNLGYGYTFDQVRHRYPPYKFIENNKYLINAPQDPAYIEELYNIDSSMNESIKALEAAVQLTNDAHSWYSLGIRHYENEHDMDAIYALRKCVEREPLLDAYATLAVVYTNENFRLDAFDAITKWLDLKEEYKETTGIATTTNRIDDQLYERMIACLVQHPNDGELQMMMGVLCHLRNDLPRAVDCFKAALVIKPDDHKLWNKLGATFANQQQTELARDAYFKALELHPTFIRARYNLAIACISENNYKEAIEHVLQSLKIQQLESQPTSDSLWSTLKMAALMLDRPDLGAKCDEKELDAFKAEFDF